ncbi:MAG: amidohydrolase family protein [Sphingomonadales bacterium]|jgi:imidazolonepropionase-like amidohydrolase|nr:amidohydrolase family protein [Sphingomonadales bacterium]MBP7135960.1 amidohydrolase family protein [Sphingomonadaceae bacterium]MBK6491928.1 amidohydrolase family protein [Sphingomonadales bacterium]MBK6718660.1 amidohydrolase family protein [Sphingomonadales bacterium]MBK8862201.1 amidohydrolase family protein [Sphingomonadales bacterium]
MKRRNALAVSLFAAWAMPASAETVLVLAGHVITDAARPARGPSTITVTDGRITAIDDGLARTFAAGVRVIDLSTKTVLPGLIDAHVHLTGDPGGDFRDEAVETTESSVVTGAKNARITALAGFTTVRDLGSATLAGFALRDGTAKGFIPGPRILSVGSAISIIGGHGDVSGFRPEVNAALDASNTCTGAVQCAERVREASKRGADVIKITATGGVLSQQGRGLGKHFTDEEMASIVSTAHGLGLKVAAHAHSASGVEGAVRAGVDSIEHGTFADAAGLKEMKARGTWFVPTLMAFTGIRERLGKNVYTPTVEAKVRETLSHVGEALKAARALGVRVAFGTDAGVFEHGRNAEEFAQLVSYGGMTPAQALASATTDAAMLLGLENQVGRIAPGYSADMIAVDGDPLTDVRVLEKVKFVMVRGRVIE